MAREIRRLVTGHDSQGKAVVISDAPAGNILESASRPGVALTNLWTSYEAPARFDVPLAEADAEFVMFPKGAGTVVRISEFEPEDPDALGAQDGASHFAELGEGAAARRGGPHPFMHQTETLDYAIVLDGEVTLVLDDSEVELAAGDVVIQRGTNHAWSNRGTGICRIAFILMAGVGARG